MVCGSVGSPTWMGWKRRSRAASFSKCLRYSSSVVAPIVCSSPRASSGLRMGAGALPPAREHRLEDGGRVDRALGGARTHEGVDLVDEDDDVAARADLLGDLLQALL